MKARNMSFLKGMGAGMLAGMAAMSVGTAMLGNHKKSISKTAGKTMKAVGNIAESITYLLK